MAEKTSGGDKQQRLISCLRDLLPLAERYLSHAPSDPDNAKLETARGILQEYGPSTGESAQSSSGSLRKAHQLTLAETNAVLSARSGEAMTVEHDISALADEITSNKFGLGLLGTSNEGGRELTIEEDELVAEALRFYAKSFAAPDYCTKRTDEWIKERAAKFADTPENRALLAAIESAPPGDFVHAQPSHRPRGAYIPLTEEQIDELRPDDDAEMVADVRASDMRFLCDMAMNCLLYGEEINRLRSTPSHVATTATRADAIVGAYLEKCDRVYPDGSSAEDIERDLRNPILQLERELADARTILRNQDAENDELRAENAALARSSTTPVAWRYRYGPKGMWKYVDRAEEMNPGEGYERESLYQLPLAPSANRRRLLDTDPYCPSCGHNRDKSATSSIDATQATGMGYHYCQICGANWDEIGMATDGGNEGNP